MAATDFEPLSRGIGELRALRDRLVAALTESITRLRTLGTCPSSDVLETAGRYRHQYLETRERLSQERCALLAGPTASLEEWEQAIRLAQRQQQVTDLLDDAEALQVRGVDGPGPLARVLNDVEDLRRRMNDVADQHVNDLLEGRHPLTALLKLVHHSDSLADELWADLLDCVSNGYGRELATAISRGKIRGRAAVPWSDAAATVAETRESEVIP